MTEVPELRLVGEQARGIITLVRKNTIFFSKTIFIHFVLFLFLGQTRHYGRPICPQCPFVQIGQLLGNGSSPRNLLGCQP